jgi:glycosyltransferase involved in cell wall biosynthesis
LHTQPQPRFAFVGRISPEKGADRAVAIARACGMPLDIAAKVDFSDRPYFESTIEPLLDDPQVRFVGEIGQEAKNDFIGNALALLMPIDWPEPFGLVMIEAMACGTPVIAYNCGAVPEIVEDGVTGFIVEDLEQAIAAAKHIEDIDRRQCRLAFERRFVAEVMARQYLEVYRELVERSRTAGQRMEV